MYCVKCGVELEKGRKECPLCKTKVMYEEIDNTYELLRLMDGEPGAFFPIVADDAHEDAFLLSAQLPRQLVQKAQIMLAHMRDVDKIYESKNK